MEQIQSKHLHTPLHGGDLFVIREAGRGDTSSLQRIRHTPERGRRIEYILRGSGYISLETDGTIRPITEGQLLLLSGDTPVTIWSEREHPCIRLWFLAEGTLADTLFTLYRIPDLYIASSPALPECLALFDLLQEEPDDPDACARAAAMFTAILTRTMAPVLFPADRRGDSIPRQMQLYIDSHLYEDLNLDALSARFGYAKMHLIRLFREECGQTPIQYVLRKRMEAACKMLTGTVMPVMEIAMLLQYSSAQHFTAAFRRYTGVTPTQYRKDKK
ncbi:MAG: helix-turn-helix transcriptional regulator [Clostridia bacterium]|nr:helix-turn-helix transcriptional regulator [Clostridia bacterium]